MLDHRSIVHANIGCKPELAFARERAETHQADMGRVVSLGHYHGPATVDAVCYHRYNDMVVRFNTTARQEATDILTDIFLT